MGGSPFLNADIVSAWICHHPPTPTQSWQGWVTLVTLFTWTTHFGVDKLPSPESQDNFGKDMRPHLTSKIRGLTKERSGAGISLPTEARETFGSHSAARTWNWGDRAPSPSNSEIKEGEVGQEEAPSELQEEYDLGTRVSILRAEAVRLRRIYVQAWRIYEREIALSEVVDAMVDELDNIEA
ncbi:hypothetical protein H4582DRAFT_2092799 [Lactarius indigo]|nr:hypothetical protein H4582DRAFT_2092799 [Lactarius indigo]